METPTPTPTPTHTHAPVPPTKLTSQQTHGGNEQRNTRASDDLSCGLDLSCGRELGRGLDRTLAPEHITHDCTDSSLVMSQTSPKPTKHNNPNPNDCHAWKRCTRCVVGGGREYSSNCIAVYNMPCRIPAACLGTAGPGERILKFATYHSLHHVSAPMATAEGESVTVRSTAQHVRPKIMQTARRAARLADLFPSIPPPATYLL